MSKKYFSTTVSALTLVLAVAGSNMSTAWAEEITYNGSQADYKKYHGFLGAEGTFVTSSQSAVNNIVTIDNPDNLADDVYKAPDIVTGASVTSGSTSENTVNIQGTSKVTGDVYGAIVGNGVSEKNKVVITGGQIGDRVIGGVSNEGSANNNSVELSGGNVTKNIYGGFGTTGASYNTVTINGGTASGNIYGGESSGGDVKNNSVVVKSGSYGSNIFAGYTDATGVVDNNTLTLNGGTTTVLVAGGASSGDASVSNNQVIMDGSANASVVAGGYINGTGDAIGNSITISGTSVVDDLAVGGSVNRGNGSAKDNVTTISGDANVAEAGGGNALNGTAQGNKLVINGGTVQRGYGGLSMRGSVKQNTVEMSGGTVKNQIIGGRSQYDNADDPSAVSVSDNQVTISGGTVEKDVFGGAADTAGNVTGNVVTMSGEGTNVKENLVGGLSNSGDASGNTVNLNGGSVGKIVFGGNATNGRADRNIINVTGGSVGDNVIGGRANKGTDSNQVLVSGGTIKGQISGGYSTDSASTNNTVTVKNVTVTGDITSGYVEKSENAEVSGNAEGNSLIITDEAIIEASPEEDSKNVNGVTSGYTQYGSALKNTLLVTSKAEVNKGVVAGVSENGDVSGNSLTISGEAHLLRYGVGGKTLIGDATNNSVSIEDATIDGNVYGGYTSNGNATDNLITLTGEKVKIGGIVYGGFTDDEARSSADVFTGNTLKLVHFRGNLVGIENVQNYDWVLPKDVVNNETLVHITGDNPVNLVDTTHHITIDNDGIRLSVGDKIMLIDKVANAPTSTMEVKQGNFLIYDMKAEQSGNGYLLTAQNSQAVKEENSGNSNNAGNNSGENTSNNSGSNNSNGTGNNSNNAEANSESNTVDNSGNTGGNNGADSNQNNGNGSGDTSNTGNSHNGSIGGTNNTGNTTHGGQSGSGNRELAGRLNPQTKAFSEGRAASLGFLNQGADLIANAGIRAARSSVAEGGNNPWQMNLMPFFVIDGSSNRYKTGSHADVDGFNMAVGLATGFELADKHPVTLGAFFEYGRGTYDTSNSFANYASVHGDGDTHYTGGGVLGRIDFAGTGLGWVNKLEAGQADGLYAEASFRAGHIDTDFDTDDILGEFGEGSDYDSGADYYGLHGGVGYVMNFDERNSLDVYGRYFWTKIDSETVDVGRDRLHFDEADSSRLRIGTRYTMIYNQQLKPYVGIAYDHEFDGEVAARAYGFKLDKPSLEGDTGIVEAGISMKPVSTIDALSVDVTGQGFIGRREGGGGGLKIKYQF
ncbi:autotransporter outer membrane beta-barrel domain-containing protein [Bartonella sp. M0283]|uniref:autotransporter outer membrane beta-barrel domain-containing protein n=1 Tax=Bartonella sp. M0283 TaxID=2751016 RepID=UPI0018DB4FA6|nr:autotransporter outer membrane beta-barrel domain-containing protein [Bartonella sp. M0283]MBI0162494.1 autotransporter outer membrane beta-barrel domain-containing protein [Bartonella sp. M0283]